MLRGAAQRWAVGRAPQLRRLSAAAAAPVAVAAAGAGVRLALGICAAGGAGAGAVTFVKRRRDDTEALAAATARLQQVATPSLPEPDEFAHPYESASLVWRFCFGVKRVAFLVLNFCPLVAKGLADYVGRGGEQSRQRFLDSIVAALERGGATCLKFGQWISMRPDLFPTDIVERLASLRDCAPQHSLEATRATLRASFDGKDIEDLFESFDPTPVASGSIAQVYRATLRREYALPGDVREVAVKVRHPSVIDESYFDMPTLFAALDIVNRLSSVNCTIPFAQGEFYRVLAKQMDLKWEAFNLLRFAQNFREEVQQSEGSIAFPTVSTELLSESVLVESWAAGRSVDELFTPEVSTAAVKKQLADKIYDLNLKMFLRDNFVHGDMHAGNLLYDEASDQLTLLDAGLVTELEKNAELPSGISCNDGFGDFLRAMCARDFEVVADCLIDFHDPKASPCIGAKSDERDSLAAEIGAVYTGYYASVSEGAPVYMGQIMGTITQRLSKYGICLRGDISACLLTISVSEGLLLNLDPAIDIVTRAAPYFVRFRNWTSVDHVMNKGYNGQGERAGDGTKLQPTNAGLAAAK